MRAAVGWLASKLRYIPLLPSLLKHCRVARLRCKVWKEFIFVIIIACRSLDLVLTRSGVETDLLSRQYAGLRYHLIAGNRYRAACIADALGSFEQDLNDRHGMAWHGMFDNRAQ